MGHWPDIERKVVELFRCSNTYIKQFLFSCPFKARQRNPCERTFSVPYCHLGLVCFSPAFCRGKILSYLPIRCGFLKSIRCAMHILLLFLFLKTVQHLTNHCAPGIPIIFAFISQSMENFECQISENNNCFVYCIGWHLALIAPKNIPKTN